MLKEIVLTATVALTAGGPAAHAQTPAPPAAAPAPCSGPEARQLDFWVGDWIGEWTNPDGTKGTATNHVTSDEYGGCVIFEHFRNDDGSLKGMSVSTWVAPLKAWRQTWVDDQGGYFDLSGGPVSGQAHSFELVNFRPTDKAPYLRMIWQDVTADSFLWRWQKKAGPDAPWTDSWVIRYRRAPPQS